MTTILRLLNFVVILALVASAGYVYKIKYEATLQAASVAKMRAEIRRERDAIAALRAEWSKLDQPQRIQALAQRHLTMKPIEPRQFDTLDNLPDKPIPIVPPGTDDPIAAIIESAADLDVITGSLPTTPQAR
jgi:cell division protein FtsL